MEKGEEFRELMQQVFRTRMAFRRSMQRTLKRNKTGITFEMLQVLSSLWHEQGITQQELAARMPHQSDEQFGKERLCLPKGRPERPTQQTCLSYAGRRRVQEKNTPNT